MCFREKIDIGYRIPQIFMEFYEIIFKGGQCDDVLFMFIGGGNRGARGAMAPLKFETSP